MMQNKKFTAFEWVALGVVGGLSLLNIISKIMWGWNDSFIISIIGLCYCLSFWLGKKKIYIPILFIWALAQTIEFKYATATHVFDLDQVFSFGFMFTGRTNTSATSFGVGFAGIGYTILAVIVRMDSMRGKVFKLKSLKRDSVVADALPADVKIIKRMTIGDDRSWYLVKHENSSPEIYALIQGKEEKTIRSGKNQIVHYYKVEDPQWVLNADAVAKNVLKTGGWAVVE